MGEKTQIELTKGEVLGIRNMLEYDVNGEYSSVLAEKINEQIEK